MGLGVLVATVTALGHADSTIATPTGGYLGQTVTPDYPAAGGALILDDVSAFRDGGGHAVFEPGTEREEHFSYAAVDRDSFLLRGIERSDPLAHAEGTFVASEASSSAPTPPEASEEPVPASASEEGDATTAASPTPPRRRVKVVSRTRPSTSGSRVVRPRGKSWARSLDDSDSVSEADVAGWEAASEDATLTEYFWFGTAMRITCLTDLQTTCTISGSAPPSNLRRVCRWGPCRPRLHSFHQRDHDRSGPTGTGCVRRHVRSGQRHRGCFQQCW